MPQSLEDRFQNLHEFVTQARTNLDRNNWDYLIGGSETETTLARNRDRLPAAGIARCLEHRLRQLAVRQEAAHPGAVRAGRLIAGVRPGRGCDRRRGDADLR